MENYYFASMYEKLGARSGAQTLNNSLLDTSSSVIKKPAAYSKISAYLDERSFFQPNESEDDTASENETLDEKEKRKARELKAWKEKNRL